MKLILCPKCDDMFKLSRTLKSCKCGLSQGRYLADGLYAQINMAAVPIGIANSTLARGLVAYQWRNKDMDYSIDAWVFRVDEPHIERVESFGVGDVQG